MINKTCLPIAYADSFYQDVVKSRNDNLNKFAYHNGFVVGAICTRIEPLPKDGEGNSTSTNGNRIYILTLGVLAAYRDRGIGQKLVQSVLDYYEQAVSSSSSEEGTPPGLKNVKEITLHVQISNHDAIKFYKEKFGFEQGEKLENYYKRIDPPHCYVLRKTLS